MASFIIATATVELPSALAILRLSGEGVLEATDKLFDKEVSKITKRTSFIGTLSYKGEVIDHVVLLAYKGPASYTGEDMVEIMCHGSPLIIKEIKEAYIALGGRLAGRGEFSSLAFLNGKMDLVEASAVNDVINALTHEAKNLALMAYSGKASSLIRPIKDTLGELLANIEVSIDYPEYDEIEEESKDSIVTKLTAINKSLEEIIHQSKQGSKIAYGLKVAIVGEPNVGKSSLLNALLGSDKAIVSNIPGTTRDIVEGDINLDGVLLHLLDTAGLRENAEELESLGIQKSIEALNNADIIIHVHDLSKQNHDEILQISDKEKIIIDVYNKADLATSKSSDILSISALNRDIEPLLKEIKSRLSLTKKAFTSPSLYSAREIGLLNHIYEDLEFAIKQAQDNEPIDLITPTLLGAYNLTKEILGEDITNDLSDEIFSRFCVGK